MKHELKGPMTAVTRTHRFYLFLPIPVQSSWYMFQNEISTENVDSIVMSVTCGKGVVKGAGPSTLWVKGEVREGAGSGAMRRLQWGLNGVLTLKRDCRR